MKAVPTELRDVILIEPPIFSDNRGHFFESFNHSQFQELVAQDVVFVQDNQSFSRKGVVRGLHYQLPPKAQGKLVRVVHGEIFDVAVDLRRGSPQFGKWVGERLSADNRKQLWIPAGFAHGFQVISDTAEVLYKTTHYWSAAHERSVRWDDPTIAIEWPLKSDPVISDKDRLAPLLHDAEY